MNLELLKKKLAAIKAINSSQLDNEAGVVEYKRPQLSLLKEYNQGASLRNSTPINLETKLYEFGFESAVEHVRRGPVITRYEMKLARGVRISQVRNVADDLAISLMSDTVRIQAPIPGTGLVGIEVVNESPAVVGLKRVLSQWDGKERLPIALGTDTGGAPKIVDLAGMPHLLVAGQTGSGKSVFLNSVILSILFTRTPDECRLVLVDPKRVEMSAYKEIPHLRCPVVTEPEEAVEVFASLIHEMEKRYEMLADMKVRTIESYNSLCDERLPYIVTIVDEMADLMMTSGKKLELMIVRLAQLARAVGIHLILATQKPVVKVITGLIKSNMPSRISFKVASKADSRVILDSNGAEKLAGRGDMLVQYPGVAEPERFHGAWVSDREIDAVTEYITGGDK